MKRIRGERPPRQIQTSVNRGVGDVYEISVHSGEIIKQTHSLDKQENASEGINILRL